MRVTVRTAVVLCIGTVLVQWPLYASNVTEAALYVQESLNLQSVGRVTEVAKTTKLCYSQYAAYTRRVFA